VFRRLLPRLGYQSAVWAIAHRLCRLVWEILHEGISYIEQGTESEPRLLIYRAQYLAKQLRKFGYTVQISPACQQCSGIKHVDPVVQEMIFDGVGGHKPRTRSYRDILDERMAIMRQKDADWLRTHSSNSRIMLASWKGSLPQERPAG
jgi:hypothetical protein